MMTTTIGHKLPLLLWLILGLLVLPVSAQTPADEGTPIGYGARLSGTINDRTPRMVYYFDGARCDVLGIRAVVTSGSLDLLLNLFDADGRSVFYRDDTNGSSSSSADAVRIPRSDRYYLVVGRFGHALGTTTGDYELSVERVGVSPASGCVLRYGDTVPNTITDLDPQLYYSFRAQRGDILNIYMQRVSGTLDPYIQVVNSAQRVIADNDDITGGQNAKIENLLIEETGIYVIIASRYGQINGRSTGGFVLSLEESRFSGLGNSSQAPVPLMPGDIISDTLTDLQPQRYYTFTARRNDIITLNMKQDNSRLDPFLRLANAGLQELISDDDSGDGKNARIERFMIPADGLYYVIAGRYEGSDAVPTIGRYLLTLETLGNAFENVPPEAQQITYGSAITGRIDDSTPQILYAFWGVEGDTITVSMNRGDGNLDPVVSILNENQRSIVSDDDSGGDQNARIERYTIQRTGVYYIRATRYSGSEGPTNTNGSFILVLARRFD